MRTITKWTGLRRYAAALGVAALLAGSGSARGAVITTTAGAGETVPASLIYNTSGYVGNNGVTGPNVISFVPVSNSAVQTSTSLSLGTFVVAPLPGGVTTTYNHTPFAISYATKIVNGTDVSATQPLLTLTGFFNGQVTGGDQSNVIATFDPITDPTFKLTDVLTGTLSLPSPQRTLVPSTTFNGQSTAEGFVTVQAKPVPEPTTIALLVVAGAGVGLRRRMKAAK